MSLRAKVVLIGLAGASAAMSIGVYAAPWLGLSAAYLWKVAIIIAAAATIIASSLDASPVGSHPFPRLGPANQVTFVRALLLAFVAGFIGEAALPRVAAVAVVLAIVSELLDACDGWLARRSGMASRFGARFDMETDALLILVLSILVWLHGKAGVWVLAGGLMRYAFVAAGWVWPWMAGPLTPTRRGQTIAVTHAVGLIVALAPIVRTPASAAAALATLLALTWSFAVDVGRLWRGRRAER